jgi:hypothetical protein
MKVLKRMTNYFFCSKCRKEIEREGLCSRCEERAAKRRLELEQRVAALPNLLENPEAETQTQGPSPRRAAWPVS